MLDNAYMQLGLIYEGRGGGWSGPNPRMSLGTLPAGRCGRIGFTYATSIDLERLEVMGLCAGRVVEVIQAGDPMIVRVLGTRIGLAASLARDIYLEPVASAVS